MNETDITKMIETGEIKPWENIMVTYEATWNEGPYGDRKVKRTVTRMGFYSPLSNVISVPPRWKMFHAINKGKDYLWPDGWGGDRLKFSEVIDIKPVEYCDCGHPKHMHESEGCRFCMCGKED